MRLTFLSHTPGRGGSTALLSQLEAFFLGRGHSVTILTSVDETPSVVKAYQKVPLPNQGTWRKRLEVYRDTVLATRPDVVYSIAGRDEMDVLRFLPSPRLRHIFSLETNPFTDIPFWLRQMEGYVECFSANTPDVLDSIRRFGVMNFEGLITPYLFAEDFGRMPDIQPRGKTVPEICYVGRLESFLKRAHWLPEIISRCRQAGSPVQWHVYGDGPCKPWILAKVAEFKCESAVTFHGWCDRDTLVRKLREHHAVFLCSRSEGLPVAMVEAMLCGLACVVPEVHAGISHALQDGGGWMYQARTPADAAEAVVKATADVDLLDQTGAVAQGQARKLFLNKIPVLEQLETRLQNLKHNGQVADLSTAPRFSAVKPHVSVLRRAKAMFGIGKELCPG
jgi:glycosyltransferase involved in cell wall biosynthesis